jgi:hypothetical protein
MCCVDALMHCLISKIVLVNETIVLIGLIVYLGEGHASLIKKGVREREQNNSTTTVL